MIVIHFNYFLLSIHTLSTAAVIVLEIAFDIHETMRKRFVNGTK